MSQISPQIVSLHAEPFSTPLHSPFVTSQGATSTARSVRITLVLSDGTTAQGESTPVQYVTGETIDTVLETAEQLTPFLSGLEPTRWRQAFGVIASHAPDYPSARCGIEMAILDAFTQITGTTAYSLFGGATDSIESDLTIPIVANAEALTAQAWGLGIHIFKIKVGDKDLDADFARVISVHNAAPEARIRIDANQAFSVEGALAFVDRLLQAGVPLELLEQPVPAPDFAALAAIAERCAVPVFADESCRTPQHALTLAQTAVHGFNCKINKSGIGGVLDIVTIARTTGKQLMLGCMLETRRSIALSLALACGTGAFDHIDLDSHLLLNEGGDNPFFTQHGTQMRLI